MNVKNCPFLSGSSKPSVYFLAGMKFSVQISLEVFSEFSSVPTLQYMRPQL